MTKRSTSLLSLAAYAFVALGSASLPSLTATEAMANSKCGGLNQRVCKKWEQLKGCDKGFKRTKLVGGTCVKKTKKPRLRIIRIHEPGATHCGGDGQRVCKKTEQLRGCDPGLHRTKPIGGRCSTRFGYEFSKPKLPVVDRAKRIDDGLGAQQQALKGIADCIVANRDAFRRAVQHRDQAAANQLAFACAPAHVIGSLRAAPTAGVSVSSHEQSRFFNTLTIGVGAGAMYGIGGAGETGLVLDLNGQTLPRFYSAGGVKLGVGASAGADVIVGISRDTLEQGSSNGIAVGAAGKYLAGGGISVGFDYVLPGKENPFDGIAVSGGAGVGAEIGVVNPTWSKIH